MRNLAFKCMRLIFGSTIPLFCSATNADFAIFFRENARDAGFGRCGHQTDLGIGSLLEYQANIVELRDETRRIAFLAARSAVAETDDVRCGLAKSCLERELLGVISQGDIPLFTVQIVAHQDSELSVWQ